MIGVDIKLGPSLTEASILRVVSGVQSVFARAYEKNPKANWVATAKFTQMSGFVALSIDLEAK